MRLPPNARFSVVGDENLTDRNFVELVYATKAEILGMFVRNAATLYCTGYVQQEEIERALETLLGIRITDKEHLPPRRTVTTAPVETTEREVPVLSIQQKFGKTVLVVARAFLRTDMSDYSAIVKDCAESTFYEGVREVTYALEKVPERRVVERKRSVCIGVTNLFAPERLLRVEVVGRADVPCPSYGSEAALVESYCREHAYDDTALDPFGCGRHMADPGVYESVLAEFIADKREMEKMARGRVRDTSYSMWPDASAYIYDQDVLKSIRSKFGMSATIPINENDSDSECETRKRPAPCEEDVARPLKRRRHNTQ